MLACTVGSAGGQELPGGWAHTQRIRGLQSPLATKHAEHAAFVLAAGETVNPEFFANNSCWFHGEIRVGAVGDYLFRVRFDEGVQASLHVGEVGSEKDLAPKLTQRPGVIEARLHFNGPKTVQLAINAARYELDRQARLQTTWELVGAGSASFAEEPIPARVVRVPPKYEESVRADLLARHGRVLLSELGCTSCHAGAGAAVLPSGKLSLERVAARADVGWLRKWITDPQQMKPGSGMPTLLVGRSGAVDVESLLAMLQRTAFPDGAPTADIEPIDDRLAARGRDLFHSIGCVACHGPQESPAAAFGDESLSTELPSDAAPVPFGDLAAKWRLGDLAAFLRDPKAVRTSGRMPSFGLTEPESLAIAHYLSKRFGPAPSSVAARAPSSDSGSIERGKVVFDAVGCARCHTLGTGITATPPERIAQPLAELDATRGCLASDDAGRGKAPRYTLAGDVRAALAAGLASIVRQGRYAEAASPGRTAAAPLDTTRLAFDAFHCSACHAKNGGGLPETWNGYFRCSVAADLGDEGRLPPRLDGVGARLQSPWLQRVIANGESARPYLAARMPKFGDDVAALFVGGLAAIEGAWRSDDSRSVAANATNGDVKAAPHASPRISDESLAVIGRQLAGSGGMNCITCHSFGDRPSAGTPGLDFLQFRERLRPEAFAAYALAPARFKPGTRMPRYFEEGRSVVEGVLGGDAQQQIDALWCWFERAASMPAPEGVPTGERQLLPVGDRPVVVRAFMERAGVRGIAIGTPTGLHFAFDAAQARLVEAWSGDFLDVAPMWDGRGGNIVGQLGPIVWSAPPGPLLSLEEPGSQESRKSKESTASPDSPAAATPTLAAPRDSGVLFLGYRLEPDGTPTFLWTLAGRGGAIEVDEQFLPDPRPDVLFLRRLEIRGATKEHPVWLAKLGDHTTFVGDPSLPLAPTEPGGVVHVTIEVR